MRQSIQRFRPYLKNDMFNFDLKLEIAKINKKKEFQLKQQHFQQSEKQSIIQLIDSKNYFDLNHIKKDNNIEDLDITDQLKLFNKKKGEKQLSKNYLGIFKPQSTLEIEQTKNKQIDQKKSQRKIYFQEKKQKQQFKQLEKKNKEKQKQKSQEKQIENEKKQNQKEEQDCQANQTQKKEEKEEEKCKKKRKINKKENFVRLDLKRKYQDRLKGVISQNKRKYKKNGVLKPKFRAKSEINAQNGEVYNSYIQSLSKALYFDIYSQDDSQNSSNKHKLNYTIPSQINHENLLNLIKQLFNFTEFREGQYETIINIINNQSTIFISETASGKSLTYILCSILLGGLSIIISPLISLMLDQLDHLPNDLPAACISSLITREQRNRIFNLVQKGQVQLLFITPQSLQTDFLYHLQQFPPINFVCIDEAHSLSQLSHNFRTSYLALAQIVLSCFKYKHKIPTVLCLTATANPQTIKSIASKLSIENIIRSSRVTNKNLFVTITQQSGQNKYISLIRYLRYPQIAKCKGILVYCRTRKIMFQVHNYLSNSGLSAIIFHGGLQNKQKTDIINDFRDGVLKIIVTTTALGMGLDFQNLQCIIHINMPKSIENYIQETGRAGRRNKRAYCHLFLDKNDYFTQRNYILADQLENQTAQKLIQYISKHSVQNINHKIRKDKKFSKNKKQLQETVIKRITLEENLESQLSSVQSQQEVRQQSYNQLYYCKVTNLCAHCQLRQEALLTILLKMSELKINDKDIKLDLKILPLSYESVKISFFRNNEQQLKNKQQFFTQICENSKKVQGNIYINIIQKCNSMKLKPIQFLSKLYKLAHQWFLRIQLINPIYVWQFFNEKKIILKRILEKQFIDKLINVVNQIQNTSIDKLNIFYSLSFINSRINIYNLIQKNQIISQQQQLPLNTIIADFDLYFRQSLDKFYDHITVDVDNKYQYLPSTAILSSDHQKIYHSIDVFFKHQFNSIGPQQNRQNIVLKFKSGRAITRIFMGVNDEQNNWKIYGQHSYWMKYRNKNYKQLLIIVRKQIQHFIRDNGFLI